MLWLVALVWALWLVDYSGFHTLATPTSRTSVPIPPGSSENCASITYTTRLQFEMNGFFYVLQWGELADEFDRTNRTWSVFVPTLDGFMNVIRTFAIGASCWRHCHPVCPLSSTALY